MLTIHSNLGEIGADLFDKLFLSVNASSKQACVRFDASLSYLTVPLILNDLQISKDNYWLSWMQYLAGDDFDDVETESEKPENDENINVDIYDEKSNASDNKLRDFFENLKARHLPSRKLRHQFFNDQVLVI
jgi:hypothetical protein